MLAPPQFPILRAVLLIGAVIASATLQSLAKDSVYSRSTIVLYNKNFPGSDTVASHYVTQRSIPSAHRIALDCPGDEVITRAQFRQTIEAPLQRLFSEREWWTVQELGNARRVTSNKIHVIVLAHGIPLKIKDSRPKEATATKEGKLSTDAASVDSELALLGLFNQRLNGMVPNPYFRKEVAIGDAKLPIMLVGRLDGPNVASCRRLIDAASQVERRGLWGRAYIDLAQKTQGNYKMGEDWLHNIIAQCDRDGIATVVDPNKSSFPNYYPMDGAALYFGWYVQTRRANGPFANPDFRLKKGAIACHIHSYSAVTVRSKTKEWVGPLIDKGAAGVLGNVYEPFLSGTTHLDVFFRRLLDGYTLAEATYMATPYLSWMSIVVGDPLYRPFDGFRTYEAPFVRKHEDLHDKTFHVATKLWAKESFKYEDQLLKATRNHKTGYYFEAQANRMRNANSLNRAMSLLEKAKARYLPATERLRVDIQMVDLERQRNNKEKAISMLRDIKNNADYADLPGLKAVTALLNQLDPPGPSGS